MYALHSLYSPPGRFATLRLDRQIRLDLNTYNTYFSALCIIPSISYTCFATSYLIFRLRLSFPTSRVTSLTIAFSLSTIQLPPFLSLDSSQVLDVAFTTFVALVSSNE